MKLKQFTIAGGNPTLLVWNCPTEQKKSIIKSFVPSKVDQVGFINQKNNYSNLMMMGNELCINATLALASTLKKSGRLISNNIQIAYRNSNITSIKIPYTLIKLRSENVVILDGIGFKKYGNPFSLKLSAIKYKLPAFGILNPKYSQINPTIYVQKTNTLINETACGSGSIAWALFSKYKKIKQPSGGYIKVQIQNKYIIVSAKVTNMQ